MSKQKLHSLSKSELHSHMGHLAVRECEHQAEVIEGVCEVARRKLYFDYGQDSLFDYMKGRGFPNGSAQRYIDAARLCMIVPNLNEDIAKGEVNLSQITIVATTVRQKKKEEPKFQMEPTQAAELFEKIKGEDANSSQQIVAQELKVEIKEKETVRAQANGSVRREMTLSREQEASYQRVRELISHSHPNPSFAEVFDYLAQEFLKRKDPLIAAGRTKKKTAADHSKEPQRSKQQSSKSQVAKTEEDKTTAGHRNGQANSDRISEDTTRAGRDRDNSEVLAGGNKTGAAEVQTKIEEQDPDQFQIELKPTSNSEPPQQHWPTPNRRSYLSIETVRFVHRRDQSCRWKNEHTDEVCGSKFQLQPDHIQSLWAGGSDEPENLQLLCSKHNRLKYRREAGIRWV